MLGVVQLTVRPRGRVRCPRGASAALHRRVQGVRLIRDRVLGAGVHLPLDTPGDRPVGVGPPVLDRFRSRVLVVRRAGAVVAARAGALAVAPHERADGLPVKGDLGGLSAHRLIGELRAGVERTGHVLLRRPRLGHLGHRAGERGLISDALTNPGAVVQREREACPPGKAAVNAANGQCRADRQARGSPGALNGHLAGGLARRGRGLRDLRADRLRGGGCRERGGRRCDGKAHGEAETGERVLGVHGDWSFRRWGHRGGDMFSIGRPAALRNTKR